MIRQQWLSLEEIQPGAGDLWVALDEVADPGNLGTILRTHDAVGGKGVILLGHATDPYDPSAARASMGALFSQCLVRASFEEFSAWKQKLNIPLIGTSDSAQIDYQKIHYPASMVLLMGSERQGLDEAHIRLCDSMVRIPMVGTSDSLNLAVATAVVLYEIFNQRRIIKGAGMIAFIEGEVIEVGEDNLVVKVGGVGLRIFVPVELKKPAPWGVKPNYLPS